MHFPRRDVFDLPFRIAARYLYRVDHVDEHGEGAPVLLNFRDFNGDGKALEFAFFDAVFCMGLETTLFGYEPAVDRLVQYEIRLRVSHGTKTWLQRSRWADYLFAEEPLSPGLYSYEIDYRGRGGCLNRFDIHYNSRTHRFEGTLQYVDCSH